MGERYEGQFLNGLLHGQGTHTDVLGNKWVGTWKQGMLFGDAEFTGVNKERYKGTYVGWEWVGGGARGAPPTTYVGWEWAGAGTGLPPTRPNL